MTFHSVKNRCRIFSSRIFLLVNLLIQLRPLTTSDKDASIVFYILCLTLPQKVFVCLWFTTFRWLISSVLEANNIRTVFFSSGLLPVLVLVSEFEAVQSIRTTFYWSDLSCLLEVGISWMHLWGTCDLSEIKCARCTSTQGNKRNKYLWIEPGWWRWPVQGMHLLSFPLQM